MSSNFNDDAEEIEFDDDIDIDQLQEKLKQHMAADGVEYVPDKPKEEAQIVDGAIDVVQSDVDSEEAIDDFVKSLDINEANNQNVTLDKEEEKPRLQLGEKKYIVYIEPDNVEFIDGLSIKERKKLINRIIREEDTSIKKAKERKERIKFINQVIIMVLTVVVSLPIFFTLLNKSIQITILNYQQSQQNFVRLYKEQGKVKSYKKFKRTLN